MLHGCRGRPWLPGACVVAGGHAWLRGHAWLPGRDLRRIRQDTVNERAVRILLECILVLLIVWSCSKDHCFTEAVDRVGDLSRYSCIVKPSLCGATGGGSLSVWIKVKYTDNQNGVLTSLRTSYAEGFAVLTYHNLVR